MRHIDERFDRLERLIADIALRAMKRVFAILR
jgi:hypothetical protein